MPYDKSPEARRRYRGYNRDKRHEGWRQTVVDCDCKCQFRPSSNAEVCGSTENLELHEPFAECKSYDPGPRLQQRVLLCMEHHEIVHFDTHSPNRARMNYLVEDVMVEIEDSGGYSAWLEKFDLYDELIRPRLQQQLF